MAKLDKKEFATKCGMLPKNLSSYIGREQIILVKDDVNGDFIDDNNPVNVLFLEKHRKEKPKESANLPKAEKNNIKNIENAGTDLQELSANLEILESTRQLKASQVKRQNLEIERLSIENAKRLGEVVPVDMVKEVFKNFGRAVATQVRKAGDSIIDRMAVKYKLTAPERSLVRRQMMDEINSATKRAISISQKEVTSIVNEYQETRLPGERV